MDLKQMEYIIAIADEQSISKAAEKVFLTQSALNQQLLKLEKELGTPLFERRYHAMVPTFAGRTYLSSARQMADIKEKAYKIIRDNADNKIGEISIGVSPDRGSLQFARAYPVFHRQYPHFTFNIREVRIPQMEQLLLRNEITYAFTARSEFIKKNPAFDCIDIARENLVLTLPESHRLASLAGRESWKAFPVIDIRLLADEEFVLPAHSTLSRKMADAIFESNEMVPKILFETGSTRTMLQMASDQIAPVFIPQAFVDPRLPVVYFRTDPEQYWIRSIQYFHNTYISQAEQCFLDIMKEMQRAELKDDLGKRSRR